MIAPASPADPRPDIDGLVEYHVDADASPGNVVPSLARLLIDMHRKRKEGEDDDAE